MTRRGSCVFKGSFFKEITKVHDAKTQREKTRLLPWGRIKVMFGGQEPSSPKLIVLTLLRIY